jgi:CPA2 family monovalent cation:H+ antiporter-2
LHDAARLLLEIGGVVCLLALLARLASRWGISPIPLYLIGGLAFGTGGLAPIATSEEFIAVGADIGVILLLLMLGLEYTGRELLTGLRSSTRAGLVDLVANYVPGFVAGLLLGLGVETSLFLGGVTYISSSGVIAKLLADLGWTGNRETPVVLSILVFEDLAMAVILPLLGVVAVGGTLAGAAASVTIALLVVGVILFLAARHGDGISRLVFHKSDEANLLTLLGITLVVAGISEQFNVSAAVGAFLVGIGLSGEAAERADALLSPLRDLFAGVFFVFFGLNTDPSVLPAVAVPVLLLALVTGATKVATGWWAAERQGIGPRGRWRAGTALIARGEFSIVIAGLGVSAGGGPRLSAIAAGYVLIMATAGPLVARLADRRPVTQPLR